MSYPPPFPPPNYPHPRSSDEWARDSVRERLSGLDGCTQVIVVNFLMFLVMLLFSYLMTYVVFPVGR